MSTTKERWIYAGHLSGYILLIVGSILQFNTINFGVYIFTVGAILFIAARISGLSRSKDFHIRRLNNLMALGTLALGGAVYLMWKNSDSWVLALTISVFIDLYTSFRITKYTHNENQEH